MAQHEGRLPRRLRAQRPPVLPDARPETAQTVLPDLPRVGALDALLREVDSLRLTLETDLTLAAAAVENGAPQVAADIIDSDRDGLRFFEKRALEHVAELARPAKRRVRVPAAPFVAAAAVAGFLLGVVPHTTHPTTTDTISAQSASANASLATLERAASTGQTAEAIKAANALHGQIAEALASAQSDPVAAQAALTLLHKEQVALQNAGDSAALDQVLAASRQLSKTLLTVLNKGVAAKPRLASAPAVPVIASPEPRASTSPRPTHSTSPSPKPRTSSSTRPSSSPSPSPSSGNGLPGPPGFS
ncbi:MAG: hypothetical protein JWO22_743 [Frankiales bacterium]|nr:hypothetical protein [Frankiales bacterium]